ncbi:hypothetical protein WA158_001069 [Blastocystis sp. Blastoise]
MNKLFYLFLVFCLIFTVVEAKKKDGVKENLPANSRLRIGVKYRPEVCERKSKKGDKLSMHYTGSSHFFSLKLSKFDSSLDRNQPFEFVLGSGQVIKGWDQGLVNMCIGEKRKLVIPSGLGYGDQGAGAMIPGGATLVFDVELLAIN